MKIADTIRQAREARGLTQEDLAERLEVSRQAVSKWEVGASVPTPENLKTLGEILEVTFERPLPPPPSRPFGIGSGRRSWSWEYWSYRPCSQSPCGPLSNRKKMWTCPGTRSRT